tara:strand:- start:13297 stop:14412 length:1116 start_codon:yes stop_codon:yes gene_type:complete
MMSHKPIHVVINALHAKSGGGVVFFNHIVPLLAENGGLEISVVAHEDYANRLDIPKNVKLEKVSFKGGFYKTLIWEQLCLPSLIRGLGADVTFNMANYGPLFAPKPMVYVTNNPEVGKYSKGFFAKIYWPMLVFMTRLSLIFSPKSFSNGSYMQQVYAGGIWRFLQKKMVIATTACDVKVDLPVKKNKGQVVAIGDFYIQKNYPTLLRAFAAVKEKRLDAHLFIVGRAVSAEIEDELKSLVLSLDLEKNITFCGVLPHNEVQALLACSEVYVSPSDAEAFSLTLLEAMSLGTAAVVRQHAFQYELAGDNAAHYVSVQAHEKNSVIPLADAILEVLDNGKLRHGYEKKGLEVAHKYSWEKSAQTICDTIKSL